MTHTRDLLVKAGRPADAIKQTIAALGHGLGLKGDMHHG